jgi:hypothetical protein
MFFTPTTPYNNSYHRAYTNDIRENSITKLYDDMTKIYNKFIHDHSSDNEEYSPLQNLHIFALTGRQCTSPGVFVPVPSFELDATFLLPSNPLKTFDIRPIIHKSLLLK